MAFLRGKFGARSLLPLEQVCFQCVCCLGWGGPDVLCPSLPLGPLQGMVRRRSPKHKAVLSSAGTFLRGNSKPLSTALSFFLGPVSQGGGPLGGSHIEKLGGAWGTLWFWWRSQTKAPPWEFCITQKWPEKESFVERVPSHQAKTLALTLMWAETRGWLFYQGFHLARLGPIPFPWSQVVCKYGKKWISAESLMWTYFLVGDMKKTKQNKSKKHFPFVSREGK